MYTKQEVANRFLESKDFQNALQIYLDLSQEYPGDGSIYQWIAKCYYELKKYDESFLASKEAIKLDESLSIPHLILAYISVDQGDLENAVVEAQNAYDLSPESDEVGTCYGALLLSTKKLDEGITVLQNTLKLHSNYILAHQNLATAYRLKKDYKRYAKEMRLVYKYSPSLLSAMKLLVAYQQRHAFFFVLMLFSAWIGAWLLQSKILLAIPIFIVIYRLLVDFTFLFCEPWKGKGKLREFLSSLITDCSLGIITYGIYFILATK